MQANKESNYHGRRGIAGAIRMVVGAASLLGCGQPPNTGSDVGAGPIGRVTVALEAVGSDGAAYQFPPGSYLAVFNTPSETFDVAFALDGTETVLAETLPIGNYAMNLDGARQLIRTVNGISQTVPAISIDPQPVTFSIVQNMTTPLVLHFAVASLVDVTFQTGRLQLSIDVSPTSTTMANHGQESATFTETSQLITAGLGLEAPLGLVAGETDSESLTFDLTSAFALSSPPRELCANISVDSVTSPSSSTGFRALMEEVVGVTGAAGTVCITDFGAQGNDQVHIRFSRTGAAPVDQQAFLPGTNYKFAAQLFFDAGGEIFDTATFHLSKLGTPITLVAATGASFFQDIEDLDTHQFLESCGGKLTGTFQLTP